MTCRLTEGLSRPGTPGAVSSVTLSCLHKGVSRTDKAMLAVPQDLGEVYELIYEFVRRGGKLPRHARWIEGANA